MGVTVGSIIDGKVTGITKFGAFVELGEGITGLVHISEVADAYVKDISDYLKEQDTVKVKVVNIGENGKIGLSIKQAIEKPPVTVNNKNNSVSFEDKLSKFMKDSNEKLIALKRYQEGKKGR
jgi:S1 RNA binding domain protein